MIKSILRILLLTLFVSCGIPSFEYIDEPTINSSDDSYFTFTISIDDDQYIDGFKLYSRYFIETSDDTEDYFDDVDITDTDNDTEDYLEDLGYTAVSFVIESSFDTDNYEYEDMDTFTNFDVDSDIYFSVDYNADDYTVILSSDDETEDYHLLSNYEYSSTEYIHAIGNYSDDDGEEFLNNFEDTDDLESTIYIEFVIFNTGTSSSLESLESLPVYATAIELQINN